MARRETVYIDGGDEFRADIAGLEAGMSATYLMAALVRGAEIPRTVAEELAPRSATGSHGRAPGFLSESVVIEELLLSDTKSEVAVGVDRKAFYGGFQELGTVHAAPQPFLRPAFDETTDDVVAQVCETLVTLTKALTNKRLI